MQKDNEKKTPNDGFVDETKYSMETHLIYGKNESAKWDYEHHVVAPLSSSVIFRLDSVERGAEGFQEFANIEFLKESKHEPIYIYDRLGEPNKDLLEENLAYIERGEMAVTYTTGMGAISAILSVLAKNGEHIVGNRTLYGCTFSLIKNWLPRFGITHTLTDLSQSGNLANAIQSNTRVIYFETPSNPNLELIDIAEVRRIVDEVNATRVEADRMYIVVDNTFASPFCQRPIEHGADFTVHSLTKGIGGFGTDMGGVVIGPKRFQDMLLVFRKDFGAVLSTKAAWTILTYGLPTLHLRIGRQTDSAMKTAQFLENHPLVEFVHYPGLPSFRQYELAKKQMMDFRGNFAPGGLLFFGLKGKDELDKKEKGKILMNFAAKNAYTMTLAVSLGHTRTLIEHPASMTHSVIPPEKLKESGIDPGGIRIAFGLENPDDIIFDLDRALKMIGS